MAGEHTIVVDLTVNGVVYEITGFDDMDEAHDFMEAVDESTGDGVEVEGPY